MGRSGNPGALYTWRKRTEGVSSGLNRFPRSKSRAIDAPTSKRARRAPSNRAYENKYSVGPLPRCGRNPVCGLRPGWLVGERLCGGTGLLSGSHGGRAAPVPARASLLPATDGVLPTAPGLCARGLRTPVPSMGPPGLRPLRAPRPAQPGPSRSELPWQPTRGGIWPPLNTVLHPPGSPQTLRRQRFALHRHASITAARPHFLSPTDPLRFQSFTWPSTLFVNAEPPVASNNPYGSNAPPASAVLAGKPPCAPALSIQAASAPPGADSASNADRIRFIPDAESGRVCRSSHSSARDLIHGRTGGAVADEFRSRWPHTR